MDETKIISNIRRLSGYIQDVYLQTEDEKFSMLQTDFSIFHQQIKGNYENWFPKAKKCSDQDIVNKIFTDIEDKDAKEWVKYSLVCLLNSSERIHQNIIKSKKDNNLQLFHCELGLLREMSFEAAILMEIAFKIIEKKEIDFGLGKRFYIHPRETFMASKQLLRRYTANKTHGDFVFSPTSIFLIRQSIELWLQSIFGINIVTDSKNELIKLQPEILFELLDNKGEKVNLPIAKIAIKKIHKWTQTYVHAGWLAYTWEIEHAQNVLNPIFDPSKVIIEKAHFETVEDQLKRILKKNNIKLHRLKNHNSKLK